jgi:hypothetical protein
MSRTICNISSPSKIGKIFSKKSKVSAQRAPVSLSLEFFILGLFPRGKCPKMSTFLTSFLSSFVAHFSKLSFSISQNKKQNFRTLPKSPTKNQKNSLSEIIREIFNFFPIFGG